YCVGKLVRSGIKLAIVGRPNVGKSSIFNALLGIERAIVTPLPGTTRDTLNEIFSINGIPVELIDTAGIRETEDLIEKIGVERTRSAISEADFIIAVVEANSSLPIKERNLLDQFPINLFIINKSDLGVQLSKGAINFLAARGSLIYTSAVTGD